MNIPESQIVLKKKVGESNGKPVTYIKTSGGLHLMVNSKGTILSAGPHRAVARHLAQKFDPEINWTEMSKAEHIPVEHFASVLPEYEQLTRDFRAIQGVEE